MSTLRTDEGKYTLLQIITNKVYTKQKKEFFLGLFSDEHRSPALCPSNYSCPSLQFSCLSSTFCIEALEKLRKSIKHLSIYQKSWLLEKEFQRNGDYWRKNSNMKTSNGEFKRPIFYRTVYKSGIKIYNCHFCNILTNGSCCLLDRGRLINQVSYGSYLDQWLQF